MRTFHSFKVNGVTNDALKLNSFKAISIYQPPIPFSQRFKKTSQDTWFKFFVVLKQLHINNPLVEALEEMLNYVKFLKDILSNKKKTFGV